MTGRLRCQPLDERSFPLLAKLFAPNGTHRALVRPEL